MEAGDLLQPPLLDKAAPIPVAGATAGAQLASKRVPFKKLATGGLTAQQLAIQELIAPTHKYRGRQEVILAGLAAYTVQPDGAFARQAMQIKALDLYRKHCEAVALAAGSEKPSSKSSTWSPSDLQKFKNYIYGPLRCEKASDEICKADFKRELGRLPEKLARAHRMMEIWHVVVSSNLATNAGRRPNIEDCRALAEKIGYVSAAGERKTVCYRTFERAWEDQHQSIALSYAAAGIRITERDTLLGVIFDGKLSFSATRPVLNTWFARAKFVHENILFSLPPGRSPRRFLDLSRLAIPAAEFAAPDLGKRAMAIIRAEYS